MKIVESDAKRLPISPSLYGWGLVNQNTGDTELAFDEILIYSCHPPLAKNGQIYLLPRLGLLVDEVA
jgi:hypothetical protein